MTKHIYVPKIKLPVQHAVVYFGGRTTVIEFNDHNRRVLQQHSDEVHWIIIDNNSHNAVLEAIQQLLIQVFNQA